MYGAKYFTQRFKSSFVKFRGLVILIEKSLNSNIEIIRKILINDLVLQSRLISGYNYIKVHISSEWYHSNLG